jgi:hypothetical protein
MDIVPPVNQSTALDDSGYLLFFLGPVALSGQSLAGWCQPVALAFFGGPPILASVDWSPFLLWLVKQGFKFLVHVSRYPAFSPDGIWHDGIELGERSRDRKHPSMYPISIMDRGQDGGITH